MVLGTCEGISKIGLGVDLGEIEVGDRVWIFD